MADKLEPHQEQGKTVGPENPNALGPSRELREEGSLLLAALGNLPPSARPTARHGPQSRPTCQENQDFRAAKNRPSPLSTAAKALKDLF